MSKSNQSEVARIRQQIEDETRAMKQGLDGLASTARHDVIAHRYNSLTNHLNELTAIVGPTEATTIVCETYINTLS